MSAEIIPFQFEASSSSVRVIEIDGEPWFVAKDVLLALEYSESSGIARVVDHVPQEWKGVNPINTLGGSQELIFLSEHGLYFFVSRSDKPKALPFQKWLAGDVLPTLRKRGYYGDLKPVEMLRFHTALSRTVRQLETTKSALSENILLQQVRGICSILKIKMPEIKTAGTQTTHLDFGISKGGTAESAS